MMNMTAAPIGEPLGYRSNSATRRRARKRTVGMAIAAALILSAGAVHAVNQSVSGAPAEMAGPFSHFPH